MRLKFFFRRLLPFLILQIILLFTFLFSINPTVAAEDEVLVLEWEQHWPTYMVGGTCNFGTHNFFVGDVDNDEVVELVTGGMTYDGDYQETREIEAPFGIWNWNDQNFTLEVYHTWKGILRTIFAVDLDGNGEQEIITGGHIVNATDRYNSIRIWSWDSQELTLISSLEGISASSIHTGDIDDDGISEIFTSGTVTRNDTAFARLCILRWDKERLYLEKSVEWCTEEGASARSVNVCDLDNNGELEVITGGSDYGLTNSSGQLRIWQWDGEELLLKANEEWRLVEDSYGVTVTGDPMGNTLVENVKTGDVDGDGITEIVTGGFAYDGQQMNAQLRIWNWNGLNLALEKSHEWFINDITEIKAITLDDVNGDGNTEILTSGGTAVYGGFEAGSEPEAAFLTIHNWDGDTLALKNEENWTIGEGVFAWNVGTGDVDNDGTTEIVTVGCMYINQLCDPDLRIWSLQTAAISSTFLTYLIIAFAAISVSVAIVIYLFVRKNRNKILSK